MSSDKKIATKFLAELRKLQKRFPDESVQNLVGKGCLLKMKDIPSIASGKKSVYVVPPQDYNRIELLDENQDDIKSNYFYEYRNSGNATTGSGGDQWIVANKKSLDHITKKGGVKKSSTRKSRKSAKKSSTRKSRKSAKKSSTRKSRKSTKKSSTRKSRKSVKKSAKKSSTRKSRKSTKKSPKMSPKSPKKSPKVSPKSPKKSPKSTKMSPKSPKSPKKSPKSTKKSPKSPKKSPKSPKMSPKSPKMSPKSPKSPKIRVGVDQTTDERGRLLTYKGKPWIPIKIPKLPTSR